VNERKGGTHSDRRPAPARTGAEDAAPAPAPTLAHERYVRLGRDRAVREWSRYEGTAQRDLFRQLRVRFLRRHAREGGWVLDAGSGPGRFTRSIGGPNSRRVALDLSLEMLTFGRDRAEAEPPSHTLMVERVRGDALRPPFLSSAFGEVALLGNALGFEGGAGEDLLSRAESLVAPRGMLVVEIAPGPGERSEYLRRLPPGAVRRLLAAPTAALLPRVKREGFLPVPERHEPEEFRRWTAGELFDRWRAAGWSVRETMAVAPALGPSTSRLEEIAVEPRAWERLLDLEERLGRDSGRWPNAAALLLAAERPSVQTNGFVRDGTSSPA